MVNLIIQHLAPSDAINADQQSTTSKFAHTLKKVKMNCKIVVVIIVVLCIGDAIAKKHSPKSHSSSSSDSSSSSGSNQKRAKWCDDAPLFKKQEHCEYCVDECKYCERREKFGSHRQFKYQSQIVMCNVLDAPENGFISNNDRTCGTQVTYSCKEGYQLSGSENRNCQPNGLWSESTPVCEAAVMCSEPEPPVMSPPNSIGLEGTVTWNGLYIGAVAQYQCPPGNMYRLEGAQIRTCEQGGTWSKSTPWCILTL